MAEPGRLRVRLESMAYGPEAVGRVEGRVVFALGGAPGDEAVVRITREQGRLWRGEVVQVIEPGPSRREPPCPYFGPCGGCQWQHLDDAEQLRQKSRALSDTLRRIGHLADVPQREPIGMAEPWAYRNTSQFAAAPDGLFGYRGFHTHNIVDIDHCPISQPAINAVLAAIREDPPLGPLRLEVRAGLDGALLTAWGERPQRPFIRRLFRCGAIIGAVWLPQTSLRRQRGPVEIDQEDVAETASAELLTGVNYTELPLLGRRFRVSGGAFFQVNTRPDPRPLPGELVAVADRLKCSLDPAGASQADALALTAIDALDLRGGETVVDAYAGVGAFGILAAPRVRRVILIENSPLAIADARHNAEFGLTNVRVIQASVEAGLAEMPGAVDAVLLDPPRAGCGPGVVAHLRQLAPRRIAYVSCDPATLARDLAGLCADGVYRPLWTRVVDLFPQTYHIESVTCLELAAPAD